MICNQNYVNRLCFTDPIFILTSLRITIVNTHHALDIRWLMGMSNTAFVVKKLFFFPTFAVFPLLFYNQLLKCLGLIDST